MAYRFIRDLLLQYPLHIGGISLLVILGGLVNAASLIALAPLADSFLYGGPDKGSVITQRFSRVMETLGIDFSMVSMGILVLGFTLAAALVSIAMDYSMEKVRFRALKELTVNTFEKIFSSNYYFFTGQRHGKLINSFVREISTVGASMQSAGGFFAVTAHLMFILAVPLYISWWVTLVCIGVAGAMGAPLVLLDRIGYRRGLRITRTSNELVSVIHESFASAGIILGYGKVADSKKRLSRAFDASAAASLNWSLLYGFSQGAYRPISVIILLTGLLLSRKAGLGPGETAALIYALVRSSSAMRTMAGLHSQLSKQRASWEQVRELLAIAQSLSVPAGHKRFAGLEKGIELKGVSLTYPGGRQALNNFNMTALKGEFTALKGPSGAGKTTALNLVMGLLQPDRGHVLSDGAPLDALDQVSYRMRIGYVPQDTSLFHASLRSNLLWAKPDATEQEILTACENAGAMEFINEMELGLETIVGEKGMRLSGGQAQRISLARALLRKPEILVLDEAFSSVAPEMEHSILSALKRIASDSVVIMATHRDTSLKLADTIYFIEKGKATQGHVY